MESLIKLTRSMQTGEIKMLRHFFRMLQNDDKKRNQLFEIVLKAKNCKEDDDIEQKTRERFYPGRRNAAKSFDKLKGRLRSDILNILLLQESSFRGDSPNEKAIHNYKRFMLQGDILLKRGLYDEASVVLKKASFIAQSNELYAEQLLIDNVRSNYNIIKLCEGEYIQYQNRIKTASTLADKLLFARHFYEELISYTMFRLGSEPPFCEWQEKLATVEAYAANSNSCKIKSYHNICALYFYRHIKQFDKSLDYGLALLKQHEATDTLRAFLYSGNVQLEAARCYLLTRQYDKAKQHANNSIRHSGGDLRNILSSLEVLFYSFINTSDYRSAIAITDQAFENSYLQKDKFMRSKWWFLRAGTEFKMLDYKASIISLKKCNELYKDKSHWMLACSIFETICRIENGDHEWFEYRSEGLRKIMLRHNKNQKDQHNKRFGIIYQILKTLNRNNFDFGRTLAEEKNNIALLSDVNGGYVWNPAGCEIVCFEEWLLTKAGSDRKNDPRLVA